MPLGRLVQIELKGELRSTPLLTHTRYRTKTQVLEYRKTGNGGKLPSGKTTFRNYYALRPPLYVICDLSIRVSCH